MSKTSHHYLVQIHFCALYQLFVYFFTKFLSLFHQQASVFSPELVLSFPVFLCVTYIMRHGKSYGCCLLLWWHSWLLDTCHCLIEILFIYFVVKKILFFIPLPLIFRVQFLFPTYFQMTVQQLCHVQLFYRDRFYEQSFI